MARTLKLTSPLMHGGDVSLLQKTINERLAAWKVNNRVDPDGEYGPHTRDAMRQVGYGLGIALADLDEGATPAVRRKIRRPALRNPAEVVRANSGQRKRWVDKLRKRYSAKGPELAITYATAHLGVKEHPANSNWGGSISQWLRDVQCPPAPWCGAFVNACLHAAGFPHEPWLRYCPWIEQKAKAGEGGWSWHSVREAKPGDLITYGSGIAVHVGLYVGDGVTIEGNTSSGDGGSQANGGGVFRRQRNFGAAGFPARGASRPPWGRA